MSAIKKKIAKLLNMAAGGTQAEAMIALEKANKLIELHGLSMESINEIEIKKELYTTSSVAKGECVYFLAKGLGLMYGFKALSAGKQVVLVGTDNSLALAHHFIKYLEDCMAASLKVAGKKAKAQGYYAEGFNVNFQKAYAISVCNRLKDLCTAPETSAQYTSNSAITLVPQVESLIAAFLEGKTKPRSKVIGVNPHHAGAMAGTQCASEVSLAKQVLPTQRKLPSA